ncbi:hypothetical protein RB4801 [Rhodopirellula baltica SH 1]|uniref:Uncharacterized protein n=1 Tax=Rhodopirellula baltica (strain DSM 10527 / NCIMB 13988 / SH1) TaxID=243090 RepID=Q7UH74_RHOBA|nr:hypothetical protein RB4801 [Rhodopirellula baltica SH 1]
MALATVSANNCDNIETRRVSEEPYPIPTLALSGAICQAFFRRLPSFGSSSPTRSTHAIHKCQPIGVRHGYHAHLAPTPKRLAWLCPISPFDLHPTE